MTLRVATAPFRYSGPDRLDITRKGGSPFGPSWQLLTEAKRRMARDPSGAWAFYAPRYVDEMRRSWRAHRAAWQGLLARERVVLVCYCPMPGNCHRSLLAGILLKLGGLFECEVRSW